MGEIKKFANIAAYRAGVGSLQTPNVCLAESENLVIYNKKVVADSHVAVDLGLPSGLKWANMNIGANAPEDCGLYFMWGDNLGHAAAEGFNFDWGDGYDDSTDEFDPTSNYGQCSGAVLRGDIPASAQYDAAKAYWGKNWRMPSIDDYLELKEVCTWEWVYQGGINGRVVTGPNGNTIFLPASGFALETSVDGIGEDGNYWLSTLYSTRYGARISFDDGGIYSNFYDDRCVGHTIRPVK